MQEPFTTLLSYVPSLACTKHYEHAADQEQLQRLLAENKRADQTVLPGSQSQIAPDDMPLPPVVPTSTPGNPATPGPSILMTSAEPTARIGVVPEDNIPLAPPTPEVSR
jgi:hypothetical protein